MGGLDGLSTRGTGRGRTRGRGRGRGRGHGRGRGGYALAGHGNQKLEIMEGVEGELDAMDIEYVAGPYDEEALQRAIAETSSDDPDGMEEDDGQSTKTSPDFMRSAMIANSALPTSPIAMHRRLSIVHRGHPEVPDIEGSDDASGSNAAAQLITERQIREQPSSDESEEDTQHRSKRPRAESASSSRKLSVSRKATSATIVVAPKIHPFFARSKQPQTQPPPAYIQDESEDKEEEEEDDIPSQTAAIPTDVVSEEEEEEVEEANSNEYVVESILDHSLREGVKHYRVKWAGYEDATDWLEEQDLENLHVLVEEYNEKLKGKAGVW
jgi:hypothetical protein